MPKFDSYSLRARIAPVLLAVLPTLTLCLFVPEFGTIFAAIPGLFIAAGGIFAEEIVRFLGKRLEARLALEWDGLPTVRALRHRDSSNQDLRKKRRHEVAAITRSSFPSRRDEEANPQSADELYDDAVRRCLAIARRQQPKSLLSDENARYGFRRNTLALKGIALTVIALTLASDIGLATHEGSGTKAAICVVLLVLDAALWIAFVRREWVRAQAETLSQRFFLTVPTLT